MNTEKQRLAVLNRLSADYPSYVALEEVRKDTHLDECDFRRVIAYLQEKAFIDLDEVKQGVNGVYGEGRINSAGMDHLESNSKSIKVSFLR